jgi:hypothetical protein
VTRRGTRGCMTVATRFVVDLGKVRNEHLDALSAGGGPIVAEIEGVSRLGRSHRGGVRIFCPWWSSTIEHERMKPAPGCANLARPNRRCGPLIDDWPSCIAQFSECGPNALGPLGFRCIMADTAPLQNWNVPQEICHGQARQSCHRDSWPPR